MPWTHRLAGVQADGRVTHIEDPNANDNVFGGGSEEGKPDDWSLTISHNGANPASANIFDTYLSLERVPNGDLFLYLAFAREAHEGTVLGTFELNQEARLWTNSAGARIPCRTTGDVLIAFEPHGGSETVQFARWVTDTQASNGCAKSGHVVAANLRPNVDVEASFNTAGAIQNFLPGMYTSSIPLLSFGESASKLTQVLAANGNGCAAFDSVWVHSRSSLSVTAALKDLVSPTAIQVRSCKATPDLSSSVSANQAELGAALRDTSHLTGGATPTRMLTFNLYGPGDADCSGTPAFTLATAAHRTERRALRAECVGVGLRPLRERSRRPPEHPLHRGLHRRLVHGPIDEEAEERIDVRFGHRRGHLRPGLLVTEADETDLAAEYLTEDARPVGRFQRLGAAEAVALTGVCVRVGESGGRHRRDIDRVDGRDRDIRERRGHLVTGPELRHPLERVRHERVGL